MNVSYTNGVLTIQLVDPTAIERLVSTISKSRSRKNRALLEEIVKALKSPELTEEVITDVLAQLEALANSEG